MRSLRSWNRLEEAFLIECTAAGITAEKIAPLLDRTHDSVAQKRRNMGLILPKKLVKPRRPQVFVADIKSIVAQHFNVSVDDLESRRRTPRIAEPRHVAMFFSREVARKSYPAIGSLFGGRDHSTVYHAKQKIERLCVEDDAFASVINDLKRLIRPRYPQDFAGRRPFLTFADESTGA